MREIRVQIIDPTHPHHEEYGVLTGQIKRFIWAPQAEPMVEVALEHCAHGVAGCFATRAQLARTP